LPKVLQYSLGLQVEGDKSNETGKHRRDKEIRARCRGHIAI
jgi:hypothetical protein